MKLLAFHALLAVGIVSLAAAPAPMNPLAKISLERLDGSRTSMADYAGKVLLIVNVASECGYTGQYAGLESLHAANKERGLVVMGFPCNQFGGQEPGSNAAIASFCKQNYGVSFPMFAKCEVNGENQHPLYRALIGKGTPMAGEIGWNFEKLLVGRDGRLIARYDAGEEPDSETLRKAIDAALAVK